MNIKAMPANECYLLSYISMLYFYFSINSYCATIYTDCVYSFKKNNENNNNSMI